MAVGQWYIGVWAEEARYRARWRYAICMYAHTSDNSLEYIYIHCDEKAYGKKGRPKNSSSVGVEQRWYCVEPSVHCSMYDACVEARGNLRAGITLSGRRAEWWGRPASTGCSTPSPSTTGRQGAPGRAGQGSTLQHCHLADLTGNRDLLYFCIKVEHCLS